MNKWFIKRRCWRHKKYVAQRMAQLQNELCQEAIDTGIVNLEKRQQLLKYKEHYSQRRHKAQHA
jgi:hypothetical protein